MENQGVVFNLLRKKRRAKDKIKVEGQKLSKSGEMFLRLSSLGSQKKSSEDLTQHLAVHQDAMLTFYSLQKLDLKWF